MRIILTNEIFLSTTAIEKMVAHLVLEVVRLQNQSKSRLYAITITTYFLATKQIPRENLDLLATAS